MKDADEGVYATGRILPGHARNSQRAFLALVLTFIAGLTAGAAVADEMSLLVNGKAVHIHTAAGRNLNEKNWGLGLQYDWDLADSKWRPFATASGFNDSNRNPSYYAGGGALRRFQFDGMHVDLGAIGFLMTRKDFKNERPFPGVLPVLSVGTQSVALNVRPQGGAQGRAALVLPGQDSPGNFSVAAGGHGIGRVFSCNQLG